MKKKALLTFVAAGMLCVSAGGVAAATNILTASGASDSTLLVTELFASSQIQLEPLHRDENFTVNENGLLITSDNVKGTLDWKEQAVGEFSFSYLPTQAGFMYNAKSLEVTFTDVTSGDAFTLVIEHGETMNAYVRFNGVSAGKFYYDRQEKGYTEFCNEKGLHTQFSASKISVRFDPATMCVYAGNADDSLICVWDMSEEINDRRDVGTMLDSFANYRVSFAMPAFSLQTGSIILYEVNGCKLNDLLLGETTPTVFADVKVDALKGKDYTLPTGFAYDVAEGILETDVTVSVKDPSGNAVTVTNNKFKPTELGEYTLEYAAQNALGNTAKEKYTLTVYEEAPLSVAELDWSLNDEYVISEQVYVPELWISGGLLRYGKELGKVTVEKDEEVLEDFDNVDSGFDFTFTEAGEYAFVYEVNGEEVRYNLLVNGAENRFVTPGLQNSYEKNLIANFSDFYVLIANEKVDFDFTVKFPSGKRYVNRKIQLNEVGRYALNATTTVDGKTYSFEKYFTVSEDYTDYFTPLHGSSIENGKSSYTGKSGVKVTTTASGAIVEYNEPINISKYVNQTVKTTDKNGAITSIELVDTATPFIELSVDPESYSVRGAWQIYVYITDAADPNNVITISGMGRGDYTCLSAAAPEQTLRGFTNLAAGGDGTVYVNGQWGNISAYNSTAFRVWHTYDGAWAKNTSESRIALYFDNEEKQLLAKPATGGKSIGGTDKNGNHVVVDFDDSQYLQSDMPWGGFTSDYVYIGVAVTQLQTSQATSCIYSIDGKPLSDVEEVAPVINVEAEDTLAGLKGYSLAVPTATAVDCYKNEAKVTAKVYYEKDGNRFDVSCNGGRFNTVNSGDYSIVYTATDVFGRTTVKEIKVKVEETHANLAATLTDPSEEYTTGKIADEIPLVAIEDVAVENAIGKAKASRKIYLGTEEVAYNGDYFVPQKAGVYTVKCTFTDSVGRTAEDSYELEIAVPQDPILTSALPMYVGFVAGNTYKIADVTFIDYTLEEIYEQTAKVYINGEEFTDEEYEIAEKVEAEDADEEIETLTIEYKYGNKVLKAYENLPVKTVKKAKLVYDEFFEEWFPEEYTLAERYFLTDENTSVVTGQTYFTYTSNSSDSAVWFAQPLQGNGLTIEMDILQEKNANLAPVETNIDRMQIRMVDANDMNRSLLVEIQTDSVTNKARLCINGEDYSPAFSGSLVGAAAEHIKLRYNDGYFYDGNNTRGLKLVAPSRYENGEKFEGFSDEVYVSLSLQLKDATKEAKIGLFSINDQTLSNGVETRGDDVKPVLSVANEFGGVYELNTEIELSAAKAFDALSSIVSDSLKVTVTYENLGETKYAKDVNGKEINGVSASVAYNLVLSQMGSYRIEYKVSDDSGNDQEVVYTFEVVKRQEPTIEVHGTLPDKVKGGTVVNVPLMSASFVQENSTNLTWIVVISPDTNTYMLVDVNDPAFKATELGDYVIRYCAIDAYGSYTIVEYVVNCYA